MYIGIISIIFSAPIVFAQDRVVENAGFIPDTLWLSKDQTLAGETITIYTAVWNSSPEDISGSVIFYDNDTKLATIPFILSGNGSTKVLSTQWKVSAGNHKLYATVSESKGASQGKPEVTVSLAYDETKTTEKFVSAPVKAESATGTTKEIAVEVVENLQAKIEEVLPSGIKDVSHVVARATEPLREVVREISQDEVSKAKESLRQPKPKSESLFDSVQGPFAYTKLFFFALLSFVSNNAIIFYGLAFIVLFYILRFFKNLFF